MSVSPVVVASRVILCRLSVLSVSQKTSPLTVLDVTYLMPYIRNEGEEVYFSCNTLMPSDDIHWERDGGPLPQGATVKFGVLHIPNVTLTDEGTYKCIAKTGELETETEFLLQVDDFVPVFFGSDSVEFSPLEDEQMDNLNIQITVKPAEPDGILFATERRGEVSPDRYVVTSEGDRRPPVNEHLTRLKDGFVIYEYNVGHGRDELVLPVQIPLNEWSTVEVRNEARQASVTVNGAISVQKQHPILIPFPGTNKPLVIGGQSDEDQIRRPLPGLKGVVSEVIVSGENIPLAHGTATPGVRLYDACKANPCANGGRCRKANRARGYTCVCEPPYGGYKCETYSSKCSKEHCNSGICVEKDESWHCVCPVNTSGERCEKTVVPVLRKSFAFVNKTSFLAVQSPTSLEQMKVSLKIRPQELQGDKILLYAASAHGPTPPAHISLSLKDGQLVYIQQHGLEKQELKSMEIPPQDFASGLDVLVMRNKYGVSLVVNGRNNSQKNTVASFSPTTDLYIGGFPPAFKAADGVPENSFLGCIEDVVINSRELDLSTQMAPSSGDLISCDQLEEPLYALVTTEMPKESPEEPTEEGIISVEEPTEELEVIEFTPPDEDLIEIIIPSTTEVYPTEEELRTTEEEPPTTTSTTTTTTTTTTTEELTTTTPESTTSEAPTSTEEVAEESTTEVPENYYSTWKDLNDHLEPTSTSSEIETSPAKDEEDTQCSDSSCLSTTETPDVCASHDCGINGRCEPYNASHFECICNLFYHGPRCGVYKRIEHAAHFNGDAFIEISADELPHLSSEKEEIVSLRFKTNTSNGLLMWQGQQSGVPVAGEDYFALSITNGYLHYSYELGGGAAHLVSPIRVTDGKEHLVRLERRGRRGAMFLDDLPEIKGASSGILAMLNVDGNIFIGGVPNIEANTGGLHEHNFVGCIADVTMNREKLDLVDTAVDGKNVRPCEEWTEPKRFIRYLKHPNKRRKSL